MYLYFDIGTTFSVSINAGFTTVTAPAAPTAIFTIIGNSTAAWSLSSDSGTTQIDFPANVPARIDVKDPFTKFKFKNSAAVQLLCLGQNAG